MWAPGHTVVEKEVVAEGPEAEGQQEGEPSSDGQLSLDDRTRAQPLLPQPFLGPEILWNSCILLVFSTMWFFVCFPLVFTPAAAPWCV